LFNRKTFLSILIAAPIPLITDSLFLTLNPRSSIIISKFGQYLALDQQIKSPLNFSLVILGGYLLALLAVYSYVKGGKKYSLSSLSTVSLLICFSMIILSFIAYKSYDSEILWRLYKEDNLFENLTMLLHLASSFLFLLLILQKRREKTSNLVLYLLFALFFFIAMEEISWGQRIFGFSTPQFIKGINTIDETNIHNILSLTYREIVYSSFFMLVGFIFLLRDYIEKVIKKMRVAKSIIPFLPPHNFLYFGLLILAMLLLHHYFVFWEVFELIFAVIGTTYAISIFNRYKNTVEADNSVFKMKKLDCTEAEI